MSDGEAEPRDVVGRGADVSVAMSSQARGRGGRDEERPFASCTASRTRIVHPQRNVQLSRRFHRLLADRLAQTQRQRGAVLVTSSPRISTASDCSMSCSDGGWRRPAVAEVDRQLAGARTRSRCRR